jgi:hypothetical protein
MNNEIRNMCDMKKLLTFFCLVFIALTSGAQTNAIDEMFEKYAERDGFTVVTISGRMFSLIAGLDKSNENADGIMRNLRSIQILSVNDSLLNKKLNFYTELSKKINLKAYEELMAIREGGDVTRFLIRENAGRVSELIVITGGPGGNSLISIKGDLSLKNISDLSKSMHMKELEGLENIDKKKER